MCKCMTEVNAALAQQNGRLAVALGISTESGSIVCRYSMATEKIDKAKRKPVPLVLVSFCPLCGEKLHAD